MRKKIVLFGLLACIVLLAGCNIYKIHGRGDLNVTINIPASLSQLVEANELGIDGLTIQLSRNALLPVTQKLPIEGENVIAEFSNLAAGEWNIDVWVTDAKNNTLYKGKGLVSIVADSLVEVSIDLYSDKGNLQLIVEYPDDLGVVGGSYELSSLDIEIGPRSGQLIQVEGCLEALVEELESGEWDVFVSLENADGEVVASQYETIFINPSDVNVEIISFIPEYGSIEGYAYIYGQEDHSGITVSVAGMTTVTEASGHYSFTSIPVDAYVITASKDDYYSSNAVVNVIVDNTIGAEDIYLYPIDNYGSVSGYAKFLDRTDHYGLGVAIRTMEGDLLPNLIALTDSNGYFSFPQVPVDPMTNETSYIFTAFAVDTQLGYSTDSIVVSVVGNTHVDLDTEFVVRYAGIEVMIFADDTTPWDSNALNDMLSILNVSYTIYTSADIPDVQLPLDKVVWIINDQPQEFYNIYAQYQDKFDDFVSNGGTMLFEACDQGWNGGSLLNAGGTLPGGVVNAYNYCSTNTVVYPTHPMMTFVDTTLSGSYASHNYFSNLPLESTILVVDELQQPTLVEYRYNLGRVIATGQPLEYSWAFGQNPMAIYPNMIYYTFNLPIAEMHGNVQPGVILENSYRSSSSEI